MKKLVLILAAGAAAVAGMGLANAADMPLKAPPPPARLPSWTGLYIGAHGGWGWSNVNVSEGPFGDAGVAEILSQSLGTTAKGGVFGGHLGYNWQAGTWLIGVEGDYDGAGINGSQQAIFNSLTAPPGATNGFMVHANIDSLASIRGRLGYTWGAGMLYFTGGGAWENLQSNAMISANTGPYIYGSNAATGNFSSTRSGYVVGGGLEWMVAQNWTVRAEYLYYDFNGGGNTRTLGIPNCNTGPNGGFAPGGVCGVNVASANNNISVFRLGASYKIDWFR